MQAEKVALNLVSIADRCSRSSEWPRLNLERAHRKPPGGSFNPELYDRCAAHQRFSGAVLTSRVIACSAVGQPVKLD